MKIWEFIYDKLKDDKKVVLMVAIQKFGNCPVKPGFKLALAENKEYFGNLGGGKIESSLIELAEKQFEKPKGIFLKKKNNYQFDIDKKEEKIIDGSVFIAFYPLDRTYIPIIEAIYKINTGIVNYTENGFLFSRELDSERQFTLHYADNIKWKFTERLGYNHFLYIIGSSQTSLELSRIFKRLGFFTTVLDDRDKRETMFRKNIHANSKKIISYKKVAKYIPEKENTYVVIMTHEHKGDKKVLSHLLENKYNYLGLMSSKSRAEKLMIKLKEKGFSDEDLSKIDTPIGLPIGSKTPMEIAISIAAKIISIKNLA